MKRTLVHDGMSAEQASGVGIVEHHIEQSTKIHSLEDRLKEILADRDRLQEIVILNVNERYRLEGELWELREMLENLDQ